MTGTCLAAGCTGAPFGKNAGREARGLELSREGVSAFEREEYDKASEKFIQAIKNNENDLNSRRYYAEILWREGKQNDAFRCLTDAASREGTEEEKSAIAESLAEKYLEIDQPTAALHYAEKVIDLAPRQHEGWELRAMISQKIGKNDDARADYHRALQLAPNDRDLLRNLALFESEQGDDRAALAVWEELGRFYTDRGEPADVLLGKAEACRSLGRIEDAEDYCEAALKQDPKNSVLSRLLAEIRADQYEPETDILADSGGQVPVAEDHNRIERLGMKTPEKEKDSGF